MRQAERGLRRHAQNLHNNNWQVNNGDAIWSDESHITFRVASSHARGVCHYLEHRIYRRAVWHASRTAFQLSRLALRIFCGLLFAMDPH